MLNTLENTKGIVSKDSSQNMKLFIVGEDGYTEEVRVIELKDYEKDSIIYDEYFGIKVDDDKLSSLRGKYRQYNKMTEQEKEQLENFTSYSLLAFETLNDYIGYCNTNSDKVADTVARCKTFSLNMKNIRDLLIKSFGTLDKGLELLNKYLGAEANIEDERGILGEAEFKGDALYSAIESYIKTYKTNKDSKINLDKTQDMMFTYQSIICKWNLWGAEQTEQVEQVEQTEHSKVEECLFEILYRMQDEDLTSLRSDYIAIGAFIDPEYLECIDTDLKNGTSYAGDGYGILTLEKYRGLRPEEVDNKEILNYIIGDSYSVQEAYLGKEYINKFKSLGDCINHMILKAEEFIKEH